VDGNAFDAEIENDVLIGHKLYAVKRYRTQTGASLSDSRRAVDAIEAQLRQAGRLPPPRKRTAAWYSVVGIMFAGGLVAGGAVFLLLVGLQHYFPFIGHIQAFVTVASAAGGAFASAKRQSR